MSDLALLLVALVVAYLPGLALLSALSAGPALVRVAVAPAASIAVAGVVAVVTALVGVPFGPVALAVATVLIAVVPAVLLWRRRGARVRRTRPRGDLAAVGAGVAMIVVAVGYAVGAWLYGLGGLDTRPQEHDMIIHAMQTAYITRSGHAAPWQLMPADVLTGQPVWFYPSGTHLLAAATAGVTGDIVGALNAMTVVLLAVAVCTGVAALGFVAARQLRLGRNSALLVGGVAALVMAGMYRPAFHLMHDGGILGNAVSLSVMPGVVAGVLALPWMRARAGAAVGAAVAGCVWAHPSGAVSVGVTVLAWWVGQAVTRDGRLLLWRSVRPLLVAAPITLALLVPAVGPGLAEAGRTASWPPDTSAVSFIDALGETFGFPYSGWIDQAQSKSQVWVLLLLVVGVASVIALRKGLGPVVALAAWSVIIMAAWMSPATGFDAVVTRFFYNAMLRTWSHMSLLAPVLAGLGVVLIANRVAVLARRRVPVRAGWVALALTVLAFVAYAVVPAAGYARINVEAVATRYSTPDFVRIGPDDDRAIDWLAAHMRPGERVFNSANDGSAYLYIDRGLPVVNVYTLGLPGIPYTYRLLETFNTYPSDRAVEEQLARLNVRWIYVDSRTPQIGSVGSPEDWAGDKGFQLAPGLANLEGMPGVRVAFRAGSVTVYSLDLSEVARLRS